MRLKTKSPRPSIGHPPPPDQMPFNVTHLWVRTLGCAPAALVVAVMAKLDPMKDHQCSWTLTMRAQAEPRIVRLIFGDGRQPIVARR